MSRALIATLALAGTLLPGGAPAAASTGASIDVGAIAVTQALLPGDEVWLPAFGIRNPGTQPSAYLLVVSYEADQTSLQPPAAWFAFDPASATLDGGESRAVRTRLSIPPGAEPGRYAALIGPRIAGDGGGAQVGAGAAARLTFTVEPSGLIDAWLRRLAGFMTDHAPLSWLVSASVVLAVATSVLRRRYTFAIGRRA